MTTRKRNSGVALLNVLVVLAIGAGLVQGMLQAQATAISRTSKAADWSQARALALGGIASVRTGLRRDMVQSPEADHLGEPWAQAAQVPVNLEFGSYGTTITDAQGRFNLNALRPEALAARRAFAALLAALDLPQELGPRIAMIVARRETLASLETLGLDGIDQRTIATLAPYVAALPEGAHINLNAAPEPVLAAVFANAAAARSLVARRAEHGYLTRSDLAALGLVQPLLTGWRSDVYDVSVTATVGPVTQHIRRRIIRHPKSGLVTDVALN